MKLFTATVLTSAYVPATYTPDPTQGSPQNLSMDVQYIKGSEATGLSVQFEFSDKDDVVGSEVWNVYSAESAGAVTNKPYTFGASGNYRFPVPSIGPYDKLRVSIKALGTLGGSPGNVSVQVN